MTLRLHHDPETNTYSLVRTNGIDPRLDVGLRTHEDDLEGEHDPTPGLPPLPGQANPGAPKIGEVRGHVTDDGRAEVYVFMGVPGEDPHVGWQLVASNAIVASELLDVTVFQDDKNYERGAVVLFPDGAGGYTMWEALERTWEGAGAPQAPEWRQITTSGSGGSGGADEVWIGTAPPSGSGFELWVDSDDTTGGVVGATHKFTVLCAAALTTAVVHNFGMLDVTVDVYRTAAPRDSVDVDVQRTDANTVTVGFLVAPAAGEYTIVVIG